MSIKYLRLDGKIFEILPNDEIINDLVDKSSGADVNNDEVLTDDELFGYLQTSEAEKKKIQAYLISHCEQVKDRSREIYTNDVSRFGKGPMSDLLLQLRAPEIQSSSTASNENAISSLFGKDDDDEGNMEFQNKYALIYELDIESTKRKYSKYMNETWAARAYIEAEILFAGHMPDKIIKFRGADGSIISAKHYFASNYTTRHEFANHLPAIAFIEKYAEHFDKAAQILANNHPAFVSPRNATLFLYAVIIHEFERLRGEDIIQDSGASNETNSRLSTKFEEVLGPVAYTQNILTYKTAKIAMDDDKWGIGPFQTIIGLAKEASVLGKVDWVKFDGYLEPKDLDDENIRDTLLDPIRSIYAKALTVDYVMEKLEGSWFSRTSAFQYPIDQLPFITNKKTAQKVAFISAAWELQFTPDVARKNETPFFLSFGHKILIQLAIAGSIFKLEPDFDDMKFRDYLSPKEAGSVYHTESGLFLLDIFDPSIRWFDIN